MKKTFAILATLALIIGAILFFKWQLSSSSSSSEADGASGKSKSNQSKDIKVVEEPPVTDTSFYLKPGEIKSFRTYDGYNLRFGSGGTADKPHYFLHQSKNGEWGPWETWGDGIEKGNPYADSARVTAKDTIVYVRMTYEKN